MNWIAVVIAIALGILTIGLIMDFITYDHEVHAEYQEKGRLPPFYTIELRAAYITGAMFSGAATLIALAVAFR